jgi:hypothetical protein
MLRLKNIEPDYFVSTWISELLYGTRNVVYSVKNFKVKGKKAELWKRKETFRKLYAIKGEINSPKNMSNGEQNQHETIFQAKKIPLSKTLNLDQTSLFWISYETKLGKKRTDGKCTLFYIIRDCRNNCELRYWIYIYLKTTLFILLYIYIACFGGSIFVCFVRNILSFCVYEKEVFNNMYYQLNF